MERNIAEKKGEVIAGYSESFRTGCLITNVRSSGPYLGQGTENKYLNVLLPFLHLDFWFAEQGADANISKFQKRGVQIEFK